MNINIKALSEIEEIIKNESATLVYFSHEQCNVCKVLKPKIESLIESEFPLLKMYYIDTILTPEISAQFGIFAVPTIIIYFDGNESYRKSRNIGMTELYELIERPYQMLFG